MGAARASLGRAVDAGVAYVPGEPFFVDGSGANTLRLAFSIGNPDTIASGIATLVQVLAEGSSPG